MSDQNKTGAWLNWVRDDSFPRHLEASGGIRLKTSEHQHIVRSAGLVDKLATAPRQATLSAGI